jgi:hypothetical protein
LGYQGTNDKHLLTDVLIYSWISYLWEVSEESSEETNIKADSGWRQSDRRSSERCHVLLKVLPFLHRVFAFLAGEKHAEVGLEWLASDGCRKVSFGEAHTPSVVVDARDLLPDSV